MFDFCYLIVGVPWLALMLIFPSQFTFIKYILLIILMFLAIIELIIKNLKIPRNIMLGLLLVLSTGSFFIFYGYMQNRVIGFQVDFALIAVFMLTPIVAVILSLIIKDKKRFIVLFNVLLLVAFAITVIDSIYILGKLFAIFQGTDTALRIFGSFKLQKGYIESRITNESSLMFLLPMAICSYLVMPYKNKMLSIITFLSIFLGSFVALFSGRRALQAVVLLSIPLTVLFASMFKNKTKKKDFVKHLSLLLLFFAIVLIITNTILINFYNLSLVDIFHTFLRGFDWLNTSSGIRRKTQTVLLVNGWQESPFLGHGLGSYLPNYIRSYKTPWSYEMVYISLLYQVGILGVLVYAGVTIGICKAIINRVTREKEMYPYFISILIGFICFIVAGAINPLVYYVWPWAIALACIHLPAGYNRNSG